MKQQYPWILAALLLSTCLIGVVVSYETLAYRPTLVRAEKVTYPEESIRFTVSLEKRGSWLPGAATRQVEIDREEFKDLTCRGGQVSFGRGGGPGIISKSLIFDINDDPSVEGQEPSATQIEAYGRMIDDFTRGPPAIRSGDRQ